MSWLPHSWTDNPIVRTVVMIGEIGGGIGVIATASAWLWGQIATPPPYKLDFTNVDAGCGHDASSDDPNRYRANFSAIIYNRGKGKVFLAVSEAKTKIDGQESDGPEGNFPLLEVGPGLGVNADLASIPITLEPGDVLEGRVDWLLKYGRKRDELIERLPIKGSIGLRLRERLCFLTWNPDGDSALPSGMVAKVASVSPTDTSPATAAVNEAAAMPAAPGDSRR